MIVLSHVLTALDLLDRPDASGKLVAEHLRALGDDACSITVETVAGEQGSTDFIQVTVPGSRGRTAGGDAPTLGVVGRLGGLGARPELIGYVSDGDGATAAVATAAKLLAMHARGDILPGDVVVSTHICPDAPTRPHDPVPFMDSPVDITAMNEHEVTSEMDAVLSIDTTKGNRIVNHRGIAISPTVRAGYILPVSADLVSVLETVSGEPAVVFALSTQDITPYGNGLHHLNSILQPAVATAAPVVGVAITTVTPVAGCATGASHEVDIALAARFAVEVAKGFTSGTVSFHDEAEAALLESLYGPATHLQTTGTGPGRA
ncbi:DUF1177 domain-containing protein [Micromonospora sp. NBRC 101691]|uniref:DUF1177 domain-containing protein n=1 Tax=Micromonospora sp. NBRC 101691 TaxID=3032198 RepID=UPI0024A1190F|nr:DUF1177 domain-containing protein [Micromonospora sp. NBRC 101691]GLY25500.1 hypothetical protein Misp04_52310 [Micromonospora sp. NBRC 101691]